MQDGNAIPADEAGEWLRTNLKDKPDPKVTFRDEAPDPVAYRRVLEILFHPRTDEPAA
ncbi:hypothetical protein RKE30_13335 [Streptomyces sp. Li-HN-5-11]|uniref:hypothetical protein n=1 Tax=Streptomyces sp. Li-HN-5-11 TaxID=3075432 RepID=UPI0028A96E03|nr:hypothetical protein [Streptomyces sp. Li-HN-5-11]WNM31317.1 hypothetical protein RKE30_13335 [Streptomyces sp. Li-HN-5-11]